MVASSRSPFCASEDDYYYQHLQNKGLGPFKGVRGQPGLLAMRCSRHVQEKAAARGWGHPVLPRVTGGWRAGRQPC